jgi:hypothetical protein
MLEGCGRVLTAEGDFGHGGLGCSATNPG